jgi:hypothetical protein
MTECFPQVDEGTAAMEPLRELLDFIVGFRRELENYL